MLSEDGARDAVKEMLKWRAAEADRLDLIHQYFRGLQSHPSVPSGVPNDVRRLAQISRVNMTGIVVGSVAQSLYIDGYRQPKESEEAEPWRLWQANGMDKRQIGVHRAALVYGTSYVMVLPGMFNNELLPVLKGYSPRRLTVLYEELEDWPTMALRADPAGDKWSYRLYDDESVYWLEGGGSDSDDIRFIQEESHGIGMVPIIRFDNEVDLDEDNPGEVEGLMALQDQIDITTFGLLVAQHFSAFRQRYIIGWTAESENQVMKAAASRIMTFEDTKDDVSIGEFEQTDLSGYINSREESLKHAATISQTPVHELVGALVNLSAEALVASEAGHMRKVGERQTSFGESWEEVLGLAGEVAGFQVDPTAEVRWRDTESRAWNATVDGLGKLVTGLGVPATELWEKIPGITQQDVQRWKEEAEKSGALEELNALLAGAGKENGTKPDGVAGTQPVAGGSQINR